MLTNIIQKIVKRCVLLDIVFFLNPDSPGLKMYYCECNFVKYMLDNTEGAIKNGQFK